MLSIFPFSIFFQFVLVVIVFFFLQKNQELKYYLEQKILFRTENVLQ